MDISTEKASRHFVHTINESIESQLLPIINYNDAMSSEEMNKISIHADNDKNALDVAKKIHTY